MNKKSIIKKAMKKHNGKGGSYGMTGMANSMKNSMSTPATINMPQQNTPQPSPTNIPGLNQVRLSGAQVGRNVNRAAYEKANPYKGPKYTP